jgi:hypothetical protein
MFVCVTCTKVGGALAMSGRRFAGGIGPHVIFRRSVETAIESPMADITQLLHRSGP